MRTIARRYLSRERVGHTLQSTALVHEAYLKMVDQRHVEWQNRAQFFGMAATLMRRVLVDLLVLDQALDRLQAIDEQQSRLVELRFFGGLSIDEAAVALGVSAGTVKRDWNSARAWLFQEMNRPTP